MGCSCDNNDSNCSNCFGGITIPQGPIGPKGDKGEQGEQGLNGAAGLQGDKGDKGDTGAASTIAGPKGDTGAVGPAGPQGQVGETGAQGPQGLVGADGPQGLQGIQGPAGNDGVNSTVFDAYLSDFTLDWDAPLVSTLVPGMSIAVGSGTGTYLIKYDLFIGDDMLDELVLKINGAIFETIDVSVLRNDGNNISNHVITNVDDGNSVQVWAKGTDGFVEKIKGFKFSTIRLG